MNKDALNNYAGTTGVKQDSPRRPSVAGGSTGLRGAEEEGAAVPFMFYQAGVSTEGPGDSLRATPVGGRPEQSQHCSAC